MSNANFMAQLQDVLRQPRIAPHRRQPGDAAASSRATSAFRAENGCPGASARRKTSPSARISSRRGPTPGAAQISAGDAPRQPRIWPTGSLVYIPALGGWRDLPASPSTSKQRAPTGVLCSTRTTSSRRHVDGCSVFVEGDRAHPTVYHSNAFFDPKRRRAGPPARSGSHSRGEHAPLSGTRKRLEWRPPSQQRAQPEVGQEHFRRCGRTTPPRNGDAQDYMDLDCLQQGPPRSPPRPRE